MLSKLLGDTAKFDLSSSDLISSLSLPGTLTGTGAVGTWSDSFLMSFFAGSGLLEGLIVSISAMRLTLAWLWLEYLYWQLNLTYSLSRDWPVTLWRAILWCVVDICVVNKRVRSALLFACSTRFVILLRWRSCNWYLRAHGHSSRADALVYECVLLLWTYFKSIALSASCFLIHDSSWLVIGLPSSTNIYKSLV